ncbi:MAG: hypothetical protein B6240_11785 [Desulfobacteraceae bacterium 4572_87]|nr:MAG: hypothetical protein B6240_11785 [Desulfobacteraceae bacterium 4572_87]
MDNDTFDELLESVKEGGAILGGEKSPSRRFVLKAPDVRQLRERYALTQREFATLLGVSIKTLRNWEQGRRSPHGSALVLLQVAARYPQTLWDVVRPSVEAMKEGGISC